MASAPAGHRAHGYERRNASGYGVRRASLRLRRFSPCGRLPTQRALGRARGASAAETPSQAAADDRPSYAPHDPRCRSQADGPHGPILPSR